MPEFDLSSLVMRLRKEGNVSNLLTLSTRHLPPETYEELHESACAYINADQHDDNGVIIVWADRLNVGNEEDYTVNNLGRLADALGCSYVMFDPEAELTPGLPVFKVHDEALEEGCRYEPAFGDRSDVKG
jgi:hypothetical protein